MNIYDQLKNKYRALSSVDKAAFLSGFIICFIVNMFLYTNTCFIDDSIAIWGINNGIHNGRYLVYPLYKITQGFNIPSVIGFLQCIFSGLTILFMARVLNIDKPFSAAIISGLVITSSTAIFSNLYFSSAWVYTLSLLFAVLAVWSYDKKRGWIGTIVFTVLATGIYQAYAFTAMALIIMAFLLRVNNAPCEWSQKKAWAELFKRIVIVGAGFVLYYIVWKILLTVSGTEVTNHLDTNETIGIFDNGIIGFVAIMIARARTAFSMGIEKLFQPKCNLVVRICSALITAFTFLVFVVKGVRNKRLFINIIGLIGVVLCIYGVAIVSGGTIYDLVLFAYILIYIAAIPFIEKVYESNESIIKTNIANIITVSCIVLCIAQYIQANAVYTNIKLAYDNTHDYMTRVVDRIEQVEGVNANTKVIVVAENYRVNYNQFHEDEIMDALNKDSIYECFKSNSVFTYSETIRVFMKQQMGCVWDIEIDQGNGEYAELMSERRAFPKNDCIYYDAEENLLVIKLTDISENAKEYK